jgi:hypothetical protein
VRAEAPVLARDHRELNDLRNAAERHPRAPHVARARELRDGPGLEPRRVPHVGRERAGQRAQALDAREQAVAQREPHPLGTARALGILRHVEAAQHEHHGRVVAPRVGPGQLGKLAQEPARLGGADRDLLVVPRVEVLEQVTAGERATGSERETVAVDEGGERPRRTGRVPLAQRLDLRPEDRETDSADDEERGEQDDGNRAPLAEARDLRLEPRHQAADVAGVGAPRCAPGRARTGPGRTRLTVFRHAR